MQVGKGSQRPLLAKRWLLHLTSAFMPSMPATSTRDAVIRRCASTPHNLICLSYSFASSADMAAALEPAPAAVAMMTNFISRRWRESGGSGVLLFWMVVLNFYELCVTSRTSRMLEAPSSNTATLSQAMWYGAALRAAAKVLTLPLVPK